MPRTRSPKEQELILEYAKRWRALHDTWQPPPKPLPPAELMQAAERWHRERSKLRRAQEEAERWKQEAACRAHSDVSLDGRLAEQRDPLTAECDDAHVASAPRRPRPMSKRMSTVSRVIRERTRQEMTPSPRSSSAGAELSFQGCSEEESHQDEAEVDATPALVLEPNEDCEETSRRMSTGSVHSVHEPTSPRSPAGARRIRCALGVDRRMLLVPRGASFEEVRRRRARRTARARRSRAPLARAARTAHAAPSITARHAIPLSAGPRAREGQVRARCAARAAALCRP